MRTFAIASLLAALCVASTDAVDLFRRRTQTQHKSLGMRRVENDETYDPYLGISERGLAGHADHGSMSMSMKPTEDPPTPPDNPPADPSATVDPEGDVEPEPSTGTTIGVTVSAIAAVGAMILL